MAEQSRRIERFLDAVVTGVHANQILIARKADGAFPGYNTELSDRELDEAVAALDAIAAPDGVRLLKWIQKGACQQVEKSLLVLEQGLPAPAEDSPFHICATWLSKQKTECDSLALKGMATLVQLAFEVERDGSLLQSLFRIYNSLDILIGPSDVGLVNSNDVFLQTAGPLAEQTAPAPFDVSAAAWQIMFRKIENWNIKHRNLHTADDMARELLENERAAECVPFVKAMAAERIAVLGHSFSMWLNWSSDDMFASITREFIRQHNQAVQFTWFGEGGMTALRAQKNHFDSVVAWRPDRIILICVMREEEDYAALAEMSAVCREQGVRLIIPDTLYPENTNLPNPDLEKIRTIATRGSLECYPTASVVLEHPAADTFVCLDEIHCRTSYHKLMAVELIRYLSGI